MSIGHNPTPLGCINSPSLSSPTQTQRMARLRCLRGAGLRQIYTEIPHVVEDDLLVVPANGRQLTLNVESQPPPTPLTTTIFRSCQSQLAKVQQKRTRFNIFAGKHPFSACCGHITRRASVLCGYIASTARNPALCTMWWILTIYWDQQLYSDAQSIHVFRQLASTGLPARTPAMSRRPRPGTERVAHCIG